MGYHRRERERERERERGRETERDTDGQSERGRGREDAVLYEKGGYKPDIGPYVANVETTSKMYCHLCRRTPLNSSWCTVIGKAMCVSWCTIMELFIE